MVDMVWRMAIMVCTTVYSFLQPIEKIGEWWFVKRNSIFGKRKARQTFVYEPFFRGIAEVCFGYKQVSCYFRKTEKNRPMNIEKIPHIVLIYPSNFPDELISEETIELNSSGLNVEVQKVENEPYNALEWILPTAFGVYILKPFSDAFLSEAGKDFYILLKKALKKVAEKGKQFNYKLITARESTQKLSGNYNQSVAVSINIQTKNNRRVKLLFDNDLEKEDWDNAIDQLLEYVIENYENCPNDSLTKKINSINETEHKTIYGKINPETKIVEFFDDNMMFSEFKNKNNS